MAQSPWFYDSGISKSDIQMRGKVVVQPAKKLAEAPLGMLHREYGFRFILPHILYDEGLSWDPVAEYASYYRLEVPCVYWDAPIRLFKGLRRDQTKAVSNRIYAVHERDVDRVLNCANDSLFLNPQADIACRLGYTSLEMLDFNRKISGTVESDKVKVPVLFWTICYAELLVEPAIDKLVNQVTESFRVARNSIPVNSSLRSVIGLFHDKSEQLTEAIDNTELADGTDSSHRNPGS